MVLPAGVDFPSPAIWIPQVERFAIANCSLTCIVPLRRRMPDVFDHGSNLKLVGTAGFGLPKLYKMDAPDITVRCREL